MKQKKRIYIAGPMRGLPQYNYPAFNAAEEWLMLQGWEVVNPARMSELYGKPDEIVVDRNLLRLLMHDELVEIANCNAIFLLRGWEKSAGARGELALALHLDMEIIVQGGGEE